MYLIVVESPTKARTIQKFLSNDYIVRSSFGHVRDLPKSDLGIDVERDFEPHYVIPRKAQPHITELKKELQKADGVILATDEDREGEAIAWHLSQALGLGAKQSQKPRAQSPKIERIVFHEITKSAIENALKNPREIDMNLVDAQQARRMLDRLVGYKLSPFLWKKISRGLSAGRVQSVAVRLIVDREREIEKFVPEEYWSVEATLRKETADKRSEASFTANLYAENGEAIPRLGIKIKEEADKILSDLEEAKYKIQNIERKETRRNPLPPFTTSTLQQEASKKFGISSRTTMSIAQSLYEHGYITYHRTDSVNLSEQSLSAAERYIEKEFGSKYSLKRLFKTKSKGAQEAHEAIRPAFAEATAGKPAIKTPDELNLDPRQKKIYDLIWKRFIASQMAQAIFDATSVDVEAKQDQVLLLDPKAGPGPALPTYTFRANGSILKFDGFLKIYPMKFEENELPKLSELEALELIKLTPAQHFTQPPARYSEATLIRELEKNGIGRPSTYAPIISTIQDRSYVEKNEQKKFTPTEMGIAVNDLLVEHFSNIVDIHFTVEMEGNLDDIAQGKKEWAPVVREFYEPFAEHLKKKYEEVEKKTPVEETDKTCPECGKNLVIRFGRFGRFYACSGFPDCRHTEPLEKKQADTGITCPKCLASPDPAHRDKPGSIVEKRTKKGKFFYGCNRYPGCDFALWDKPVRSTHGEPTGEKCPKCNSLFVWKNKKAVCSNKECEK